ncbi:alpha/beta hydrolase [Lactiplantibacillus pentosus]|uniref:alpha/beta hydrolase n=1 Tax=Lactiplantibacillus pentosus TaxID=1589 RepID=UPI001CFF8F23|nr:alpha/beta hydrolase [Lactiplantibacillus pentosus]MCB5222052.1 alpha/beta hydrolase [Lactiplantibacillus pentosus]MCT3288527.1 alpha/beta hydrolase [Lactiplantibacillus pentosus]
MTEKDLKQAIIELRTAFKTNDDARDAGLPREVAGVERLDDLSYGPDPKWHLLDLYRPTDAPRPLPVIINIHGGGWCYGTKETYQFYGLNWAQRGFAFVNPNYRLAPDAVFPDELDDVDRYIHWVADHADEYGLDRNNVFLLGDSAGGQMAEQYAAILTNPDYRDLFGYQLTDLHFRAVVLNSAAAFPLDEGMVTGAVAAYFTPEAIQKQRDQIEAERYIQSNYLPTFICTATEDFIRNNSAKLDGFLTAKGIEHVFKMYGDEKHPRGHVFLVSQKDDIAKQATDDEMAFLNAHLSK